MTNAIYTASLRAAVSTKPDGEGADARWFQITPPPGEYPVNVTGPDGKDVPGAILILDEAGIADITSAFRDAAAAPDFNGLLVDREHFSLDPKKPSDALAWATDIRNAADKSIWMHFDFTPEGLRIWKDKVLVSRSPVFDLLPAGGKRFRPTAITSVGLTNAPHFKQLSTRAAARASQTKGTHMENTVLTKALGMAEGATDEDILAKLQETVDKAGRVDQAETAQQTAETAAREHRATAFISANRGAIKDEAAFRAAYIKDPDLAEAMIATCKTVATPPPGKRVDISTAATPKGAATSANRRKQQTEAVNAYRSANRGATFAQAFAACAAADPETFSDNAE